MDWNDSPSEAAFRSQVRALIEEHLPERYRALATLPHEGERVWEFDRKAEEPERREAAAQWASALSDRNWVAPGWPEEYGGGGLSQIEQFVFNQELASFGAPAVGGSGVKMLGPTLILNGTEEQKREHLPKILSGEMTWAQGFSEPGSGSDLASLQTRATRDGDDFVINGQKIWTSGAHTAERIFALVRTDPEAPKHKGITFLIFDIKSPGVSVSPLVDMTWSHYFNETFFDDVRVPVAGSVVGEENRGWYVSMTLLDFERSNISGAVQVRRTLRRLVDEWKTGDGRATMRLDRDPTLRTEIADRYIESEVQFQFAFRIISMQNAGVVPNYEASTGKLYNSELAQRVAQTGVKTFGLYGNLWDEERAGAPMYTSFARSYLRAVPATIRGGTSEIQRNIIATRGLGLPRG